MMDISSLQAPKTGRSRFSKALPTPPEFDRRTQTTTPRELPDEPPAPPPPEKTSTLIASPSTISLRSKAFESPLPLLPIMTEPPRPRAQAGPISRKPVAHLPTSPASVGPDAKTKAARRQSSISSLLSAYSRSSSDWAQRSSHESDFTKESEPSYSPEREGLDSLPPVPPKKSVGIVTNITSDKASEVTSYTIIDSFPPPPPPPPPLKDLSRPRTPSSTVRSAESFKDGEAQSTSLSPTSLRSGSPPAEIWRRRASSKSDASLVIAELKLPSSNGSTASTSLPPVKKAEPPSFLPPLPAKIDTEPALPLPPKQHQQSAATLPPRIASLPGRNIRPIKQVESFNEDKMGHFPKLSKLKGLLNRGGSDDDSGKEQKRDQKTLLKKSPKNEQQQNQYTPDIKGNTEAAKPEPPAKDNIMHQQYVSANAPTTAAAGESLLQTFSSDTSPPPPNESGKATGTAISRRPVGAAPARNLSQLESQVELDQENTSAPNVEHSSTQTPSTVQPRNPVGSLPHPRQRQKPPQRGPAPHPPSSNSHPHPHPRQGPTSPTGGTPRSVSTLAQPSQFTSPAMPMAGLRQAPGAIDTGSPIYQPQLSTPVSLRIGEKPRKEGYSLQELIASPRVSPVVAPNAPFLTQPLAPNSGRETAARDSGFDADTVENKYATERPMSAAAAAAIALFPRKQNWNVECSATVNGVWPPNPLSERHYKCHVNHNKLLDSRNTNYPLACQTCGGADKERRFMCTFCSLRICMPCADLLVANGRNLQSVMAILKTTGKIREWDQYPKRSADQDG
ncbi:hypothetical protein E0Z10_g8187 [Xylaria hypoxylon]|uniref:Uncharacterized protein n=1 Tax=Xylaria hypoxylon TaxID=37992 RepID=A0A4Z0YMD5_9PEZI|nr:hypothetical protein E0Z10_g8187 [Xylaria hypoxylon]